MLIQNAVLKQDTTLSSAYAAYCTSFTVRFQVRGQIDRTLQKCVPQYKVLKARGRT